MNPARALFGSLLVALGALFLLDAAGVVSDAGGILADWWPVALLAVAATAFFTNPRHWVGPVVIAVVGGGLLLTTTDVVDADVWEIIGPALVIFLGLVLVFRRPGFRGHREGGTRIDSFNAFSGTEIASHSPGFEGGSVGVVFGGVEIDLRDATPAPDARLDVFTAFAGTEIRVPDGWRVDVHGLPLFGGFENVTAKERVGPDAPRLEVSATVLFGGLEVKH
jgi:hypothetical protein